MYANVVSTLAFCVGGFSLAWQIWRTVRWSRPVVTVAGRLMVSADLKVNTGVRGNKHWTLEVIVANIGDRSTQIVDVYWEVEQQDGALFRVTGSNMDGTRSLELNGDVQIEGGAVEPTVPCEIQRNQELEWLFDRPLEANPRIAKSKRGRPVVVYISRTKQRGTVDGNPYRSIVSGEWHEVFDPDAAFASSGTV
jgi:hypothetical protein